MLYLKLFILSFLVFQPSLTFQQWDANSNNLISRYEFHEMYTQNFYNDWDKDNNGIVNKEDFLSKIYVVWDIDNDNLISDTEWHEGFENNYADFVDIEYFAIDTDGDGMLNFKEYIAYVEDMPIFETWDMNKDEKLNEFELSRMIFNLWDIDDSNFISVGEYQAYNNYYMNI